MKFKLLKLLFLVGLVLTLVGCGESAPTASESPLESPLDTTQSSLPTPSVDVVQFQLDKPITAGTTRVTGSGPAGVPIILADITFGGPILTTGRIDSDGRFELELGNPLEARHRIGIALGDLRGTGWQPDDFSNESFHGDEARTVPQIGFFFDTCIVSE